MTRSPSSDGRLDYTQWASRLTHSEHEKAQDDFIWRRQPPEPPRPGDAPKQPPDRE